MYEAFYHLARRPFVGTPDPNCWFPTELVQHAHDAILLGMRERAGVAILSGAAGVGKTLLCERFVRELGNDHPVVFLRHPRFATRRSLLQTILGELELPFSRLTEQELRQEFERFLNQMVEQGHLFFLICDEAHLLEDKIIEELRAFSDLSFHGQSVVRLLLAGQLELEERLATPELQSLAQRITTHSALETLSRAESLEFLDYRLTWAGGRIDECFTPDALAEIVQVSGGSPRCLSLLADHALLLGFALGEKPVSVTIVENALNDLKHLALPWQLKMVRSVETAQAGLEDSSFGFDQSSSQEIMMTSGHAVDSSSAHEGSLESNSTTNLGQRDESSRAPMNHTVDDWEQLELSSIEIGAGVEKEESLTRADSIWDNVSAIEEEIAEQISQLIESPKTSLPGKFEDWSVMSSEPELKGQHFAPREGEPAETTRPAGSVVQHESFDDSAIDNFGFEAAGGTDVCSDSGGDETVPVEKACELGQVDSQHSFQSETGESCASTNQMSSVVSEQEALEQRLERMLAKWRLATDQDQIRGPHTPFSSQSQPTEQPDLDEFQSTSTSMTSEDREADSNGLSNEHQVSSTTHHDEVGLPRPHETVADLTITDSVETDGHVVELEVPSSLFVHPSWGIPSIPQDFVPFSDPTKLYEAIEESDQSRDCSPACDSIPVIPLPENDQVASQESARHQATASQGPSTELIETGIATAIDQILPLLEEAEGLSNVTATTRIPNEDRQPQKVHLNHESASEISASEKQAARLAKFIAGDRDEIRERALAADAIDLAEGTRAALDFRSQESISADSQAHQLDRLDETNDLEEDQNEAYREETFESWEADDASSEIDNETWLNTSDALFPDENATLLDDLAEATDEIPMNDEGETLKSSPDMFSGTEEVLSNTHAGTASGIGGAIDASDIQPSLATRYRNLFSILRRRSSQQRH